MLKWVQFQHCSDMIICLNFYIKIFQFWCGKKRQFLHDATLIHYKNCLQGKLAIMLSSSTQIQERENVGKKKTLASTNFVDNERRKWRHTTIFQNYSKLNKNLYLCFHHGQSSHLIIKKFAKCSLPATPDFISEDKLITWDFEFQCRP